LLGVKPAEGRFFLPDEDRAPGLNPVMVLSHGLWQRRFGMDPKVVGRELTVNGRAFTVVGVAPRRFKGVNAIAGPDFWVPMMMYAQVLPRQLSEMFQERRALFFNVAGRLKPGAELGQAESNLKTIARRLEQEYPEPNKGRTAALLPLTEATIFPGIRQLLVRGGVILMTVVVLVLLIACSNVANLLLARAAARRKEIAIRLSIGASPRRLVRQLLVESLLLSLAAGGFGLLVAFWGRDLIWSIRPPFLAQNTLDLTLDSRVLLFTLFVSLATGLVFGLVPALQASRPAVVDELKEGVRAGFGRSQRRISLKALVIAQVALSLVALVAAGLFLRSLEGAQAIDPGFETENLAVLTVNPGQRGYEPARGEQFYQGLVERLRSLAGVRSVSLAVNLPLFGGFQRSVFLEDQPQEAGKGVLVLTNAVGLDYFGTTGIGLVRGRDFTQSDREARSGWPSSTRP
jgi:predicted permease